MKDSLELELDERSQVDNVISFFMDSSKRFLEDDEFYKPSAPSQSTQSGATLGKPPELGLKSEQSILDPDSVLDDNTSNYAASELPTRSDAHSSVFKKPMTKKEMQAFMKAKLAKTKI